MLQYNPSISGSLSVTGSLIVTNGVIGTVNGVDIQIFSSSISQVVTNIQTTTGSQDGRLTSIESFTSSTSARLGSIETISASNVARLNSIETISASNIGRLNSIETISASNLSRIGSLETISASNIARINSLETTSASVDTLNTTQNTRLTNLEIKTGSLATTGSNTFYGTQIFSGTLYVQDNLVVQGSSSLQNITASAVSIGTNTVLLNTSNPSVRFGGLSVVDSGSAAGKSGSLYFDSTDDEWVFVHAGNTAVTSSIMITGPETYNNVGNETKLTTNRIPKSTNNFHIVDSSISDDGNIVQIQNTTLAITGSRVGINTSFPTTALEVSGSITTNNTFYISKAPSDTVQQGPGVYLVGGSGASYTQLQQGVGRFIIFGFNGSGWVERLTINNTNGRVGIGTTNASKNLHVYADNGSGILIGRNLTNDNFSANLFLYPSSASSDKRNWAITTYYAAPGLMEFRRSSTTTSDPYDSGTTVMTLDGVNDKVGIGVTNPNAKLQILGSSISVGQQSTYTLGVGSNSGYDLTFGTDSSFAYMQSWTSKPLLINSQGNNVGINTTGTPGYSLDVNGDAKSNRLYISTNANNIFTRSNGSSYNRFLYAGSNLHVVFTGGTTANNGAFGVNNFEDTVRLFNVENNGNVYVNGKFAVADGYSTYSQVSVNGSAKINRSIYNWYQESFVGNSTYLHIKTNLWGGGSPSGNSQYTMSLFKGYLYGYSSASVLEGTIGFHNWSGIQYQQAIGGNLFVNSYISSDGYVVLVINSGAGECGVTIDWHQAYAYPFREAIRTASKLHGATTGGY